MFVFTWNDLFVIHILSSFLLAGQLFFFLCYINFCYIQFMTSFTRLQVKCAGWVIYTKTNHIMHDIYGLIVVIYCSQQYMWVFFSQLYRENLEFYLSPYENSSKMRLCFLALVPDYIFFYKQSIFDPRPKNCLSFSKKSPRKIV